MKNLFNLKKFEYPKNKKISDVAKEYNESVDQLYDGLSSLLVFVFAVAIGYVVNNGFTRVSSFSFWDIFAYSGLTVIVLLVVKTLLWLFNIGIRGCMVPIAFGAIFVFLSNKLEWINELYIVKELSAIPFPSVIDDLFSFIIVGVPSIIFFINIIYMIVVGLRNSLKLYDAANAEYLEYIRQEQEKEARRNAEKERTRQQKANKQNDYNNYYEEKADTQESINFFAGCKSAEDVKARYRALSKQYHPDLNAGDKEIMQIINKQHDEAIKSFQ